jgi:hypothetical protein
VRRQTGAATALWIKRHFAGGNFSGRSSSKAVSPVRSATALQIGGCIVMFCLELNRARVIRSRRGTTKTVAAIKDSKTEEPAKAESRLRKLLASNARRYAKAGLQLVS